MQPYAEIGNITLYHGDRRNVLASLDAQATACVTDPPYGLAFMGRSRDDFQPKEYQEWCEAWSSALLETLLPGAHALTFGGTRTVHRLTVGMEDAGFKIRDRIAWLQAEGFPKSYDIAKGIDEQGLDNPDHLSAREDLPAEALSRQAPEQTVTVFLTAITEKRWKS